MCASPARSEAPRVLSHVREQPHWGREHATEDRVSLEQPLKGGVTRARDTGSHRPAPQELVRGRDQAGGPLTTGVRHWPAHGEPPSLPHSPRGPAVEAPAPPSSFPFPLRKRASGRPIPHRWWSKTEPQTGVAPESKGRDQRPVCMWVQSKRGREMEPVSGGKARNPGTSAAASAEKGQISRPPLWSPRHTARVCAAAAARSGVRPAAVRAIPAARDAPRPALHAGTRAGGTARPTPQAPQQDSCVVKTCRPLRARGAEGRSERRGGRSGRGFRAATSARGGPTEPG